MRRLSPLQIGWVAGLFEGEGTVTQSNKGRGVSVSINMTDEDVLRTFHSVVGFGSLLGPYVHNGKDGIRRKPIWQWRASKRREVEPFLRYIRPFLHSRRKARITELLATLPEFPTTCPHGHPMTLENTGYQSNGMHRYCKECNRIRSRRHYKNVGRLGRTPRKSWD